MRATGSILTICLALLFSSLVGCTSGQPSEASVQTAIAQTQQANPTDTQAPTSTPEPTGTPTPLPTDTSTPTLEPTPTDVPTATPDLRVIALESENFMLQAEDLPKESKFFLPNSGWISPHHNSEILSGWGTEDGREYLEKTGRVDGWWVYYARGSKIVRAPEEIYHNIIQYITPEGALITVKDFNILKSDRDSDYEFIDEDLLLGDFSLAMIEKERQPNGKNKVTLRIETCYRNYVSVVSGYGWEDEITLDYMIAIQELALAKLEAAPLVDSL